MWLPEPPPPLLPAAGELWEKSGEGSGKAGDAYTPGLVALPRGAGKILQLSAGDSHTCALTELGAVWAWGTYRDASGVMGFAPGTRVQLTPVCVYAPARAEAQAVRIASGADHTAAVTAGGALLTWGSGQQGQLGRVGERLSDRVKMETLLRPHAVPLKRTRCAPCSAGAERVGRGASQQAASLAACVLCSKSAAPRRHTRLASPSPPAAAAAAPSVPSRSQGRGQHQGHRRQLRHLLHLCHHRRRQRLCLGAQQLRPARAARSVATLFLEILEQITLNPGCISSAW